MTTRPNLVVQTPAAFEFLYDPPLGSVRERCAYGGRGSGKSWQFARALLVHGVARRLRVLCARQYQASMADSVHRILTDQIAAMGLGGFYYATEKSIIGENGTEFLFKGLKRDIGQIKSIEGIDICWIEEAETVSKQSWRVLIPTIRKTGSEIWTTFNPFMSTDATYQRLVVKPPPRSIVRHINYPANPWFPGSVLDDEQKELFRTDPEAHAHVWGGEPWARSDAQVLNGKWIIDDFTPDESWGDPYYGADWGFANDPTVIVKMWIRDRRLLIERDDGKPQLDNDATAQLFRDVLDDERRTIRADSARPETINEMVKRGLRVVGVDKWPGSVADGISYLRSFDKIVIHSRCVRAVQEARLWRYRVDPKTDEVLPHLVDGFDHVWDGARYGLEPLIKKRPRVGILTGKPRPAAQGPGDSPTPAPAKPARVIRPTRADRAHSKPVEAMIQGVGEKKTAPIAGRRFLDVKKPRDQGGRT